MPSALQPDPSDVVEVFVGDTLEEAMAYAVASLGPDLVVRRARKVKKNLVGKDRYEVLAGPGEAPPSTDAVGSAFDALLQQAEAEETPTPVRRTTRPAPPVVAPRAAEPEPAAAAHPAAQPEPTAALPDLHRAEAVEAAPEPATETVAEPAAVVPAVKAKRAPRKAAARAQASAAPSRKAPAKRTAKPAATGWSRQRLAELGLPEAVLAGLPADDPTSDLHWAAALAEAIDAVLPPPAVLSEDSPLVVDGYGLKGVLGILDAATRGFTPGSLVLGDRTVPATATEMALVVRQAVLS